MRYLLLLVCLLTVASGAVTSSSGVLRAQPHWLIVDLGTLGGNESKAVAINEGGQIVGTSETRREDWEGIPTTHAFLWQKGKMRDLGTFGGADSEPSAINKRNQVVGSADTKVDAGGNHPDYISHAFLWQNGKMRDLGTLSRGAESAAEAINESGQIVGWSELRAIRHAVLWSNGRMIDLGTLGGEDSEATAINERGQVAGVSETKSGIEHVFLWEKGKMRDLGTVGGGLVVEAISGRGQIVGWSVSGEGRAFICEKGGTRALGGLGGRGSQAFDINKSGQVVGEAKTRSGDDHAFLWTNGEMRDLGTLAGQVSRAYSINGLGQVVGASMTNTGLIGQHAFLWEKGKMRDLGALPGDELSDASAINDRGQIVGSSSPGIFNGRAVLWTLKRG